uniref:Transmembrane protein 52 n=1 Tax=Paramormyrops kingsleyae TaxID=1676925 RepID=A0A3B3SPK6_9TELE
MLWDHSTRDSGKFNLRLSGEAQAGRRPRIAHRNKQGSSDVIKETRRECSDLPTADSAQGLIFFFFRFILIIMGTLLMCGIIAGCVKMCCRSSKPPVPTCPGQRFEVAVIDVENRSALSSISTMSCKSPLSPPPYSLYAMESPPQYDEALKMPADKTVSCLGRPLPAALCFLREVPAPL